MKQEYRVRGMYQSHVLKSAEWIDQTVTAKSERRAIERVEKDCLLDGGEWIDGPIVVRSILREIEVNELAKWNAGQPLSDMRLAAARGEIASDRI